MSAPNGDFSTRQRKFEVDAHNSAHHANIYSENKTKKDKPYLDGTTLWLAIFLFNFLLLSFVRYRISVLPEPKIHHSNSSQDVFYESKARKHLDKFMEHGPRVTGSAANERHAYKYILKELKTIQANSVPSKQIQIDEQSVTGSFDIAFLSDFVSYYRNIKNIVVLLEAGNHSEHSLLMSCHFDSAVESPGKLHQGNISLQK